MKDEKICRNCDYWISRNYSDEYAGLRQGKCRGIFDASMKISHTGEGEIYSMETSFCSMFADRIKEVELDRSYHHSVEKIWDILLMLQEGRELVKYNYPEEAIIQFNEMNERIRYLEKRDKQLENLMTLIKEIINE